MEARGFSYDCWVCSVDSSFPAIIQAVGFSKYPYYPLTFAKFSYCLGNTLWVCMHEYRIFSLSKRGRLPLYSLVKKSKDAEDDAIPAQDSQAGIPYSECRKRTQNFLGRSSSRVLSGIALIDPLTGLPCVLEKDADGRSSEKETSSEEKKKTKEPASTLRAGILSDSTSVGDVVVDV
jgi:hypothetical protein